MNQNTYAYQILWKTKGIDPAIRRSDISYQEREFHYSYSAKVFTIRFTPEQVILSFMSDSLYKASSIQNIINDVVEKIYIIYTMIFSYGMELESAHIRYTVFQKNNNEQIETKELTDPVLTDCMIGFLLVSGSFAENAKPFNPKTWTSDETITAYLNLRANIISVEQKKLKAAIYAWIVSKSKRTAFERFQYLWIAYNSLYFHYGRVLRRRIAIDLAACLKRETTFPNGKESIHAYKEVAKYSTNDTNAVKMMPVLMGLQKVELDRHNSSIVVEIDPEIGTSELKRVKNKKAGELVANKIAEIWDTQPVTAHSLKNQHLALAIAVNNVVKNEERTLQSFKKERSKAACAKNSYSFLITTFNYSYLRCRLFHGSEPIPLYGNKNDSQIIALNFGSELTENLLENYLFPTLIRNAAIDSLEECNARLSILNIENDPSVQANVEDAIKKEEKNIVKSIEKTISNRAQKAAQQTQQTPSDTPSQPADTSPSVPPEVPQA